MKEHLIIELSNGIKYVAIDVIEHNNFKYFLLTQLSNEETALSTEFDICRYDEVNNNFDLIKEEKELLEIKEIFTERLEKKKIEVSIKEKIDFENLLKLKVVSVDNYNYIFEYDDRRILRRIQFYSNTKPKVNDNVYVSRDILEEDMLAYGHITNIEELSNKIIFIIERNDTKIYLKRYYG